MCRSERGWEPGKWFTFVMCALPYFLVHFHRVSTSVVASELRREFCMSAYQLGLMSSMHFYAYAACQLPVGLATDHVSPQSLIVIGMAVAAVGVQLFAISENYLLLFVGRTITGVGMAMVYIPSLKILAQTFGRHMFHTSSGLMSAVGNLGALLASSPFGFMVSGLGWRRSFMIIAVISALVALACGRFLRGSRGKVRGAAIACNNKGVLVPAGNWWTQKQFSRTDCRAFLFLGLMAFLRYGPAMGYQGLWGVPYLTDMYGMTKIQAGNVLMWIPIGHILGGPLVGRIVDTWRGNIFVLLSLTTAVYMAAWIPMAWLTASSSTISLCVSGFLIGFMGGGSTIIIYSIVKQFAGDNRLGAGMGIVNTYSLAGGAVYQPLMGALIDFAVRIDKSAVETYGMIFRVTFFSVALVFLLSLILHVSSKWRREYLGRAEYM